DHVDAASHYGNRFAVRVEGALMRLAVDSTRQPAHDGEALGRQLEPEPLRHPPPDVTRRARAYDCDAGWVAQLGRPAHEQERRRVRDLAQIWWIVGVGPFYKARADVRQLAQFFLKRFEIAKLGDTARRVARHPGRRDLVGTELEYFLGRAELLDQQLARSRTNSARSSQCEPVNIR